MRIFSHTSRTLSALATVLAVAACGDDKKAGTTFDSSTETTVGADAGPEDDGSAGDVDAPPEDTMTSNDTMVDQDAAGNDVATDDVAVADDTSAPTGGRCVGGGPCASLDQTRCDTAGAMCSSEMASACRSVECHTAFRKDDCGVWMPACRWDEELGSCKYVDEVNCPGIADATACANTGGCVVDTVWSGCTGANWDCDTLARMAVDGLEAGCQRLAGSALGCAWEP